VTLVDILSGANVALKLVQARLITILCLLLTFVLFCWAMWLGTRLGAMIAVAWGLITFWPVLWTGRGGHDAAQRQSVRSENPVETGEAPDS
jgi:hypothetical protein